MCLVKVVTYIFLSLFLAGCKIEIVVPEGGGVSSQSGNYHCASMETCIIEVTDTEFSEVFEATPEEGWVFTGWVKGGKSFCGGKRAKCHLYTTSFSHYETLMAILATDETFLLKARFERGIPISSASSSVVDEALRACLVAQDEEYVQELLNISCPEKTYGPIHSLEGLQSFSFLEQLTLGGHLLSDLSPLGEMTALRDLGLWGNQISDLSPLASLVDLRELRLGENQISDISPLKSLVNLTDLNLSYNQISNLSPLSGLNNIQQLNLNGNLVSKLNPLSNKRYFGLYLASNQITNVRPLATLKPDPKNPFLILELSNQRLKDFTGLADISHLDHPISHLRLVNNDISDLSTLRGIQAIDIDLSKNEISDLSPLVGTAPRVLLLSKNRIRNLAPLADIPPIEYLDLSFNSISNLVPLKSHYPNGTQIQQLDLVNNNISVVGDSLSGISRGSIYLMENPILCSEYQVLEGTLAGYFLPQDCVPD